MAPLTLPRPRRSYLEDVTGLTDMFAATEAGLEDAAWMEDGSGDEWLSD